MLVEGLKDPRIGFATVTEVRLTPDLRTARVYVSIYGTDEERSASVAGLTAAAGFLKRQLSRRMRLKYTPSLIFVHDDTLDQAQRLDEVFDAISAGDSEAPEPAGEAPTLPVKTDRSELAERREQFMETPKPEPQRPKRRGGKGGKRRRR